MIKAKATIKFKKFNLNESSYSFSTGLNVIYGESGVGKSNLLDAFLKKKLSKKCNFNIKTFVDNLNVYKIFQNPDHQIVSSTVSNEITFSGECKQLPPSQLKIILDDALEHMPNDISPMMNPGFLSGGEKEILNILTAIDYSPDILLIDDGLSFLSYQNKFQCIELLKNWASDTGGIIIWATSDYEDLHFSNFCWEIRLDGIEKIDKIVNKKYEDISIPKGYLNLEIERMKFGYSKNRDIYSDLSMKIINTRSLGILGDNGSGKTTFSGLCFGDLEPIEGKIVLAVGNEKDIKIGYLDQFPEHLILLKTPKELLLELTKMKVFNNDMMNTFKNRLMRFGIQWNQISNTRGVDLSWSILRILLVVLFVHSNFDLIILDEPTFGLGFRQKEKFRLFLRECMNQIHFMIISHDKEFIKATCDNIINLDNLDIKNHKIGKEEKIKF